ncbi:imm11 family protein [Tenacibaculum sp. TC6]|uniref:imm11 family protein n=1 Tax=Tenacibaculum sp. TC6 TaxID=3423223 RepID=UPI003D35C5A2
MKYYNIGRSDDLKVIGHYPQTTLREGYNPSLPDSHWQVKPHEFPNFIPNLELELHKNANRTDYLHFHDISGFIISEKFKSILKTFNLRSHAFYPIKVYHKGELLEYFWFHYILNIWEYVDLDRSTAQVVKKFEREIEKIIPIPDLTNLEEYEKSLGFEKCLKINKLYLKKNYPYFDVIKITKVQFIPRLFSLDLLNALQESGITGFEAKLFDKINCE